MQPQRAGSLLLGKLGDSLGLQLSAQSIDYRLRGTPQLVLHGLKAQRAGDANAVLRADRVFVSLPWSTLRTRGSDLTVQRVELDAPVLDLPALQRWLASRPASGETRLPTLVAGLRIRDGEVRNDDWRIDGLNDQHAYLRWDATDAALDALAPVVGERIGLGISHPCTTFDKWRWMPVVEADYRVSDAVSIHF